MLISIAGPPDFEEAARQHAQRGQEADTLDVQVEESFITPPPHSNLPFFIWTIALHHPLSAMVGLGFAAAFAFTGGAAIGRYASRDMFRAARAEHGPIAAQMSDMERRMTQELGRLSAIQQAALAGAGRRGQSGFLAGGVGTRRNKPEHRMPGGSKSQAVKQHTPLSQDALGIAENINVETREFRENTLRGQPRVDADSLESETREILMDEFYKQLLQESAEMKENTQVLLERVSTCT